MDEYYWNLIMDIADREKVNLPREDKYSAGAIGFMYAINEYEEEDGNEYLFLKDMITLAIHMEKRKLNRLMTVESSYSLDTKLADEKSDGHAFLSDKAPKLESDIIFQLFMEGLPAKERCVASLLAAGEGFEEVCDIMKITESELSHLIAEIRRRYIEFDRS